MDPWHTEIKNVSMRIWEEMRWRCNVGTWKADSRMNKDEGRRPQKHSSTYIVSHVVCVERGREEDMVLCFWMCAHAIHMQSCEKMRYMWMAEGRHFLQRPGRDWSCWQFWECASITQQLWAVLVQATGLKRAGVSSRLPLPAPPPPPLKMCHLN